MNYYSRWFAVQKIRAVHGETCKRGDGTLTIVSSYQFVTRIECKVAEGPFESRRCLSRFPLTK